MSNKLRQQIHNELNLRETEDLLEIWRTHDHEEWSDTAFEVIQEILSERLGEVPLQELPGNEQEEEEGSFEDDRLDEWEAKLLNDENQPELYNPREFLRIKDNIDKVAFAAIIVYILLGLLNLSFIRMLFQGIVLSTSEIAKTLPDILFTIISVSFRIAITYTPLKALSQILRILMEMEFRSRKGV
jgi:hypothetical protein